MMAKPKVSVLVQEMPAPNCLSVYCDDLQGVVADINSIEGVASVTCFAFTKFLSVVCDPRYDRAEIAQEIRDLLTSEVPEVFRD